MKFRLEEDYKDEFLERTRKHIDLVNKYAMKIGKHFPLHDSDKLDELFDDYSLMKKKTSKGGTNLSDNPEGLTKEEQDRLNRATAIHITTNKHHPEYWCKEKDSIKSFNRFDTPKSLHCEDMSKEALEEMCADWCAVGEELGNTPHEWFEKSVPERWIFSNKQMDIIIDTLNAMWNDKPVDKRFKPYSLSESLGGPVSPKEYMALKEIFNIGTTCSSDHCITEDFKYTGKVMLDFAKNGKFDYTGTEIRLDNVADVAQAVSLFRESFETNRFLIMRNDEVVATLNVTSFLPFRAKIDKYYSSTPWNTTVNGEKLDEFDRTMMDLKYKLKKYNGDSIIFLHNHPISSSQHSQADINLFKYFYEEEKLPLSACIIVGDSDVTIYYPPNFDGETVEIDPLKREVVIPNEHLGKTFHSTNEIANWCFNYLSNIKETKSHLVYLGANGEIIAIQEVDNYEFNHGGTEKYLLHIMKELGTSLLIGCTGNREVYDKFKEYTTKGIMYQCILLDDGVAEYDVSSRFYLTDKHYNR